MPGAGRDVGPSSLSPDLGPAAPGRGADVPELWAPRCAVLSSPFHSCVLTESQTYRKAPIGQFPRHPQPDSTNIHACAHTHTHTHTRSILSHVSVLVGILPLCPKCSGAFSYATAAQPYTCGAEPRKAGVIGRPPSDSAGRGDASYSKGHISVDCTRPAASLSTTADFLSFGASGGVQNSRPSAWFVSLSCAFLAEIFQKASGSAQPSPPTPWARAVGTVRAKPYHDAARASGAPLRGCPGSISHWVETASRKWDVPSGGGGAQHRGPLAGLNHLWLLGCERT